MDTFGEAHIYSSRNGNWRETKKPDIKNVVYGGIAGTIVMTMMMFVAPVMTGMSMDIAAMLGGMLEAIAGGGETAAHA